MCYLSYLQKRSIPYLRPLPFSPEMGARWAGVGRRTKQIKKITSRHLQVLYHQTSFQVFSPTVQWSTPQVLEQVDQITWKDPNYPL